MKWFILILMVIGGFVFIMILAALSWRKKIAAEFAAYIKARRPDLSLSHITSSCIYFQSDNVKSGQIDLHKVIAGCSMISANDREGRQVIYENFFNSVLANDGIGTFLPDEHAGRILPQLVPVNYLPAFTEHCKMPHLLLTGLPLCVLYVVDSEQNMQYLTSEGLSDLKISSDELHELALANLRKTFPRQLVRSVIDNHSMNLLSAHDCYDASRILLIPEYLNDGEKLIVVIPDRDTLGIVPMPESGDMTGLIKLANSPFNTDKLLVNRPVLVTRNGFELL